MDTLTAEGGFVMRNTVCEAILGDMINERAEKWIDEQAHKAKAPVVAYLPPLIGVTGEYSLDFQTEILCDGEFLTVEGFVTGRDIVCIRATDENGTTVYPTPRKALIKR
jgi:hypothetical protein